MSNKHTNPTKFMSLVMTLFVALSVSALLGFRLYLMAYFPGTPSTRPLIEAMLPYWGQFSQATYIFQSPGKFVALMMETSFKESLPAWFPQMDMSQLAAVVTNTPVSQWKLQFPGVFEWDTVLAIMIWNLSLLAFYWSFWCLKEYREMFKSKTAGNNKRGLFKLPAFGKKEDSKPKAPKPEKKQKPASPTVVSLSSQESKPSEPATEDADKGKKTDSRYRERLSQVKANQQGAPATPVVRPVKMTEAQLKAAREDYKRQEGDMMVRHMIGQLQQENLQLHAQQQMLRSTFSQYFSPNVLRYLEENKTVFQQFENQKRQVSVMFCDIRGFSAYSMTASSQEVIQYLDEYFGIASEVILHRFDGVISKLMGDGLMAYWGFPLPQADHAFRATEAALQILTEVELRNRTTKHQAKMEVGIAIASGEVMIGNVGSADFKDFTLIGTPVNLAARLEDANKDLQTSLLISEETYAALNNRIPCQDGGKIPLKGWQDMEQVYIPRLNFGNNVA